MIGFVLVAHLGIADEMIRSVAGMLEREVPGMVGVSIGRSESPGEISKKVSAAMKKVDQGDGVLIFTDMFGGTPSNIGLTFFKAGKVEVISGLNLPMLTKAVSNREGKPLAEVARSALKAGREGVQSAGDLISEGRS